MVSSFCGHPTADCLKHLPLHTFPTSFPFFNSILSIALDTDQRTDEPKNTVPKKKVQCSLRAKCLRQSTPPCTNVLSSFLESCGIKADGRPQTGRWGKSYHEVNILSRSMSVSERSSEYSVRLLSSEHTFAKYVCLSVNEALSIA